MLLTKTLACKNNIRLTEYGIVLPNEDKRIEINVSDPEINTITRKDFQNNDVILHEVIFKVSCLGSIQDGYLTKIVEDFPGSNKENIISQALEMI